MRGQRRLPGALGRGDAARPPEDEEELRQTGVRQGCLIQGRAQEEEEAPEAADLLEVAVETEE